MNLFSASPIKQWDQTDLVDKLCRFLMLIKVMFLHRLNRFAEFHIYLAQKKFIRLSSHGSKYNASSVSSVI